MTSFNELQMHISKMRKNSENLPVVIGVVMLSVAVLGLGGIIYYFTQSEAVQEQTENSPDFAQKNSQLEAEKSDKNIIVAPAPTEVEGGGRSGIDPSSETGIPTGTYSNPPTSVNSFDYSDDYSSSLSEQYGSSVERNRLRQQNFDITRPDYSSPSSNNNFNQSDDNSLVEPIAEDSLLGVPNNDSNEDSPGITTIEESPFEQLP
ncbi:hypothetical protein [Pleurocapsa sp. PCC 7319]|uniref:hypothetical protein n=1 Tax=Pleurocapsa sp. PCC 7319 TaxID=118161 RepID=UPI000371C3A5|nr:hypothetical protein [Pleurocapsa sp. PCC 7319]